MKTANLRLSPPMVARSPRCFQVAAADDQQRVDAQLFRVGNLRLERRRVEIRIHAHQVRAQFGHDALGVAAMLAARFCFDSLSVWTKTDSEASPLPSPFFHSAWRPVGERKFVGHKLHDCKSGGASMLAPKGSLSCTLKFTPPSPCNVARRRGALS